MSNKVYEIAFKLGAKINSSMQSAFNSANKSLKNLKTETGNMNKVGGGLVGTLGKIAVPAVAAGAAIGGLALALKSSASKAMDFESQLSTIQALTGASNKEMKSMSALALEMGSKTKYSALEAAQGIEELLKAGITPAKIESGALEAALNLATAGELELASSAEIMSTALNAYKADAMSAADASNILAGTANASATSVSEIQYGLSQVSSVASGIGMTFKDTNVALGLFANNGLKGSDAGTSLKTMLANLQPTTKAAEMAFFDLGWMTKEGTNAFFNAKGELKSLSEIAGLLNNSLKDLSPQQRSFQLQTLFGSDAVRAANILFKEGAGGVKNFNKEMSKVSALDVATKKMDNAKGAIEQFKGAIETLQIAALTPLMPIIKKVAQGAANLVGKFNDSGLGKSFEIFKKGAVYLKSYAKFAIGVFTPIAKTILNIVKPIAIDALNFFESIISQVKDFWNKNGKEIISAVKNYFKIINAVIKVLAPVILFILKIVWGNIKGVIQGALKVIMGIVKIFSSLFTGNWKGLWQGIVMFVKGALQLVWNVWNLMMMGRLVKGAATIVKLVVGFFKGLGTKLVTNVQYYYYLFKDGFYRIGNSILSTIISAIVKMIGFIKTGITNFINIFQTARTFGVNIFMSMVSAIRGLFVNIVTAIRIVFSTVISAVITRISVFVGSTKAILTGLWSYIVNIFTNIKLAMTNPFQTVKTVVTTVVSTLKSTVKGLFSTVKSAGTAAINGLIMAANAMIGGINSLNVKVPDWVPNVGGKSVGFNIPKIPMLAQGGITTGPTLAMIGEGKEQEAVLPLSKLNTLLNGGNTTKTEQQQILYNPQYIIQGGVSKKDVESANNKSFEQFKAWYESMKRDSNRLDFKRS